MKAAKILIPAAFSALLILLASAPAPAADIVGQVSLESKGRKARNVRPQDVLVYFESEAGKPAEAPQEPYVLTMVRKEFTPRNLVVPVGSTVRFPNEDTILHNVFSVSGENRFDLGLYRQGEGKSATFEHPGIVRIFCNVHHEMVAHIVVVETPHFARVGVDGSFRIEGVPPGPGTLIAWFEQSEPWSQKIDKVGDGPVDIRLTVSKPRVPRHKNKFGKPYSRRRARY